MNTRMLLLEQRLDNLADQLGAITEIITDLYKEVKGSLPPDDMEQVQGAGSPVVKECGTTMHNAAQEASIDPAPMVAHCKICWKPFEMTRPWQKFCSLKCRKEGKRRRMKELREKN